MDEDADRRAGLLRADPYTLVSIGVSFGEVNSALILLLRILTQDYRF